MKRFTLIMMVVGLLVSLTACEFTGINAENASSALAAAAYMAYFQVEVSAANSVTSRGAGGDMPLTGPGGGSGIYSFDTTTGEYDGTMVFDGYTVKLSSGDELSLSGTAVLYIGFGSDSLLPITAEYSGILSVVRNGGTSVDLEIDLALTIDFTTDDADKTILSISCVGTINGNDVTSTYPLDFEGLPLPI